MKLTYLFILAVASQRPGLVRRKTIFTDNCEKPITKEEQAKLEPKFTQAVAELNSPGRDMFVRSAGTFNKICVSITCISCDSVKEMQYVAKEAWDKTSQHRCNKSQAKDLFGRCECELSFLKDKLCPKKDTEFKTIYQQEIAAGKRYSNSLQNPNHTDTSLKQKGAKKPGKSFVSKLVAKIKPPPAKK